MEKQNIFVQFIAWWIVETPRQIIFAWKNFLNYNLYYFSVGLLLKTLFSPWRRYEVRGGKGFDVGRHFESFVSNLIFRIIGAMLRSVLIVVGIILEIFILVFGAITLVSWMIFPVIIIGALSFGIYLLT